MTSEIINHIVENFTPERLARTISNIDRIAEDEVEMLWSGREFLIRNERWDNTGVAIKKKEVMEVLLDAERVFKL